MLSDFVRKILASGKPIRSAVVDPTPDAVQVSGGDEQMNTATNLNTATLLASPDQLNELEAILDRAPANLDTADTIPAAPPVPTVAPEVTPATFVMPPSEYMYKGRRFELICEGVCVSCARCALKLTDSVSIERGLGPDCSAKGYLEDPKSSDEMQAFIDLAEFPQLCDYLTSKYKPLGVRGLMNGLVKIASLNRKSVGLHAAICDAIDSLGYHTLAGALRDSISTIEIKESVKDPACYQVWVKKGEWTFAFGQEMKNISNVGRYEKMRPGDTKGVLVPKSAKRGLWEAMLRFYPGCVAKTPAGTIKIARKTVDVVKDRPSSPPPP